MTKSSFDRAFEEITAALGQGDSVLVLPVELIDEDPDNPRSHFSDDELQSLAETIGRRGLLQPVTVKPQRSDGRYTLRFGARRLRAARLAGVTEIRALVQDQQTDAAEGLIEQLIENDQREGLSTAELARAVARLLDLKLTQAEIGRRLGRPPEQINMLSAIRDMPPELQALAAKLGLRTLYELYGAWKSDRDRTRKWLSGRDPKTITQAAARDLAGRPEPARRIVRDPSDGAVREVSDHPAASTTAGSTKAVRRPDPGMVHQPGAKHAPTGNAVFEVRAGRVQGELVLDNVLAPRSDALVRLKDGTVEAVPMKTLRIVRIRPG